MQSLSFHTFQAEQWEKVAAAKVKVVGGVVGLLLRFVAGNLKPQHEVGGVPSRRKGASARQGLVNGAIVNS